MISFPYFYRARHRSADLLPAGRCLCLLRLRELDLQIVIVEGGGAAAPLAVLLDGDELRKLYALLQLPDTVGRMPAVLVLTDGKEQAYIDETVDDDFIGSGLLVVFDYRKILLEDAFG